MKTTTKIENHLNRIEDIRYENQHGGAYAYVQFLAYARELVKLLRPLKKVERQIDAIESISWMFNEYLAASFTPRQKAIFDNKMSEVKEIFTSIRLHLHQMEAEKTFNTAAHRQAA